MAVFSVSHLAKEARECSGIFYIGTNCIHEEEAIRTQTCTSRRLHRARVVISKSMREAFKETHSSDTLTSDFQPPEKTVRKYISIV